MKTIIRQTQLGDELKSRIHFILRTRYYIALLIPGIKMRRLPKRIGPVADKRMPIGNGQAQVIFHGLARYDLVRIIPSIGKWVFRSGSLIRNGSNAFEELILSGDNWH